MATIRPFRGIRPSVAKAKAVAALPYDVMNSQEAREMAKGNADSFLHVDKAEIDLEEQINPYDKRVYEKARENLERMIADGTLVQEQERVFYIYRLKMQGHSQTGLVVCTSIDEYLDGTIKKHELTRAEKEADRIAHVDTLNANTGPIFLAYKEQGEIKAILEQWMKTHELLYDFIAEDGVSHQAWCIDEKNTIDQLIHFFQKVENLYIADGHHRNASAVKVGLRRREQNPNYTGEEEFNFYLSVLFSKDELKILDYNRVVKDLHGMTEDAFLTKLKEKFLVERYQGTDCYHPKCLHEFGMYLGGVWYQLIAKGEILQQDIVSALDVSILQEEVLKPILGISDPRTDNRIDFIGGIRGLKALEEQVDSGRMKVAFSMFPTSMEELMGIADNDLIMPPKSTWFEPKLRSGLFIHSLEN